jgi:hypothetical protein
VKEEVGKFSLIPIWGGVGRGRLRFILAKRFEGVLRESMAEYF